MHFHVQLIDDPAVPEKRAAHRAAHWAYFDEHRDHFIARGAVLDDAGALWEGSANLIALPSRAHVDAFLSEEPIFHQWPLRSCAGRTLQIRWPPRPNRLIF